MTNENLNKKETSDKKSRNSREYRMLKTLDIDANTQKMYSDRNTTE